MRPLTDTSLAMNIATTISSCHWHTCNRVISMYDEQKVPESDKSAMPTKHAVSRLATAIRDEVPLSYSGCRRHHGGCRLQLHPIEPVLWKGAVEYGSCVESPSIRRH